MPRILIVDDDEAVTSLLTDVVEAMGHEAHSFLDASQALKLLLAEGAGIDLIIADINMPDLNGFEFRDMLQSNSALRDIPFVFLTGADEQFEKDLAERMQDERVMLKPPNVPDLKRAISSMLGTVERGDGPFSVDALLTVLRRVDKQQGSAVLTVHEKETSKRLYFDRGRLVFAISNDPSELVGQTLIRRGIVSERGLARLFEQRGNRPMPLGEVLVAQTGDTTETDLQQVLTGKIQDAALDVFLWTFGWYEIFYGPADAREMPFLADIPLGHLIEEGEKRATVWRYVQEKLPDPGVVFELATGLPEEETQQPGNKLLLRLIGDRRSLGDIQLELRGQRYAVGAKLARWVDKGFIRKREDAPAVATLTPSRNVDEVVDAELDLEPLDEPFGGDTNPSIKRPEAPVSSTPVAPVLAAALVAFRSGELHEARDRLAEVLQLDPANPLARRRLEEIDAKLGARAAKDGLSPDAKVGLVPDNRPDRPLSFNETFLLTRISSQTLSVEDLKRICPIPSGELMLILTRFLEEGVVEILD